MLRRRGAGGVPVRRDLRFGRQALCGSARERLPTEGRVSDVRRRTKRGRFGSFARGCGPAFHCKIIYYEGVVGVNYFSYFCSDSPACPNADTLIYNMKPARHLREMR